MSSGSVHDREQIAAAVDGFLTAVDTLAEVSFDALTPPELLHVLDKMETVSWRTPTVAHRIIAGLQREASPVELGVKAWKAVLKSRLRISGADATRRLDEATDLGPRTALNGTPLQPAVAKVAAAQTEGRIGAEHVDVNTSTSSVPPSPGSPAGSTPRPRSRPRPPLVRVARDFGPDELRKAAKLLLTVIDQDGPEPDDTERARKRTITLGPQGVDGMSKLTGWVDPQWRATVEPILAKLAAPGMGNPDDDTPCVTGTPSQAQIDADARSLGQRTHDAFTAIGRSVLSSGELGQHNGLPVTVIVSTTLQELESGRGSAVTGGGSLLPMADVIRMASHAHHYLAVFDEHTAEAC
jgi:hypothetical protein